MPLSDVELSHYHTRITIGDKARQLLGTELGQFIVNKAQEEVDDVIDAFQVVDPLDNKVIIALQVRLKTALAIPQWLSGAIEDASNALHEYQERRDIDKDELKGD